MLRNQSLHKQSLLVVHAGSALGQVTYQTLVRKKNLKIAECRSRVTRIADVPIQHTFPQFMNLNAQIVECKGAWPSIGTIGPTRHPAPKQLFHVA